VPGTGNRVNWLYKDEQYERRLEAA
jgi:hypothetical protein